MIKFKDWSPFSKYFLGITENVSSMALDHICQSLDNRSVLTKPVFNSGISLAIITK
jgi:hypothetical protein